MRNIVQENKQFLIAFFGVLLIILSCSIFVSNSDMLMEEVAIKSIVPVYDENDTYSVGNTGVIFNDKDQVVKYNIVIENRKNYDVKVSDLQLGTKSEEFLNYTVENVNVNDVIKAGESKELVVSFETVKMDGWGRNFNDELVTTLVFDEVKKQEEEVVPPVVDTKPDTNEPTNKVENNTSNNVQPEVNEPVIEQPKEEVKDEVLTTPEDDANHELGMNQEIIVKDSNTGDIFVIFCFGAAVGVLGIGLVMVNKNKFTKYIVLFVIVGSSVKLASANEIMSLEIPINVSYESQNVMKPSGCGFDEYYSDLEGCDDYWRYARSIVNYYIQNEITEFEEYAYQFDVSEKQNGRVIATLVPHNGSDWDFDLYLQADGIMYANENANFYFAGLSNIDKINNLYGIDTSKVIDAKYMFYKFGSSLESIELNLNSMDVSNIRNMNGMFWYSGYEASNFTLDVSEWNTSNVTDMSYMFSGSGYDSSNYTLDVSGWNTSNVTNMSKMFFDTGYNSSNFTLDFSSFDTSNVTDMMSMFFRTGYNNPNFTLDLSNFDTSNVTNMRSMFSYAGHSNPNFTLDLSNFDTSNVTDMCGMFAGTGYNSSNFTLDLSNFDTSNVTDMSYMFEMTGYNNPNFTLDVSNFDTSNAIDMSSMFYETGFNSPNFTLDLSNFDTSNVTNMDRMFYKTGYNSSNLTLDLSNFDTSNVSYMGGMFYETGYNSSKFTLDLSNFDTSKVTNMSNMFYGTGSNSDILNIVINLTMQPIQYSFEYSSAFTNTALKPGSKIIVNYTVENSDFVDILISSKTEGANVVKGKLIVDVDNLSIGDEIHFENEKFNVISQDDETVTLFAKYNLGTDYRQTETENYVYLTHGGGWEYTPGPKEIPVKNVPSWSLGEVIYGPANTAITSYKEYLSNIGVFVADVDLITLSHLKELGCEVDPQYLETAFCLDRNSPSSPEFTNENSHLFSSYASWIINGQYWWTRSAYAGRPHEAYVCDDLLGVLQPFYNFNTAGVRPVIIIYKETLKEYFN